MHGLCVYRVIQQTADCSSPPSTSQKHGRTSPPIQCLVSGRLIEVDEASRRTSHRQRMRAGRDSKQPKWWLWSAGRGHMVKQCLRPAVWLDHDPGTAIHCVLTLPKAVFSLSLLADIHWLMPVMHFFGVYNSPPCLRKMCQGNFWINLWKIGWLYFSACNIAKKLEVNDYRFFHLTLTLLLHYLVQCRSRILTIYNSAFILGWRTKL